MKTSFRSGKQSKSLVFLAVAVVIAAFFSSTALAHAPTIDIVSPTDAAAIQHSSYPAIQGVQIDITHLELKDLNNVKVSYTPSVGPAVAIVEFGNPFQFNVCNANNIVLPSTCIITTVNSAARINAEWHVPAAGVYTLTVETRHGGQNVVTDFETITAETTVVAEYPALPAVVNAYVHARAKAMPGKIKGCLISEIAKIHEAWYPKNVYAPYSDTTVRTALANFYDKCSASAYVPVLTAP